MFEFGKIILTQNFGGTVDDTTFRKRQIHYCHKKRMKKLRQKDDQYGTQL